MSSLATPTTQSAPIAPAVKPAAARALPLPPFFWPLGILALLTVPFVIWPLDLWISELFFELREGLPVWIFASNPVVVFTDEYGELFGLSVAVGALFCLIGASFYVPLRRHWRLLTFLVLSMIAGPGLMINSVAKDGVGRGRPKDLAHFHNTQYAAAYSAPWVIQRPNQGRSFASGHAAMGFYFIALALCCWRKKPARARTWLALGLLLGAFIGAGRILIGSHFLSDILWAAGFVYLTAYPLALWLRPWEAAEAKAA